MSAVVACESGGLLVIAGCLYLIFAGKIYLDAKTGDVINVEVPVIGKLRSNTPALMLMFFGIVLLLTSLWFDATPYLTVEQHLDFGTSPPFNVRAYSVTMDTGSSGNSVIIKVPDIHDNDYLPTVILFTEDGRRLTSTHALPSQAVKGHIDLGTTKIQLRSIENAQTAPQLQPVSVERPEGFGKP